MIFYQKYTKMNKNSNNSLPLVQQESVEMSVGLSSVPFPAEEVFNATGKKQHRGYRWSSADFTKIVSSLNIVKNSKNRARCQQTCLNYIKASAATNTKILLDVESDQIHKIYPEDTPKRINLKRSYIYLNNCP